VFRIDELDDAADVVLSGVFSSENFPAVQPLIRRFLDGDERRASRHDVARCRPPGLWPQLRC
jgi:hypothetical protein